MENEHLLFLAAFEIKPPPCERPVRCEHWDDCAKNKKACTLFARYIGKKHLRGKTAREPSKVIYRWVYSTDDGRYVPPKRGKVKNRKRPDWPAIRYCLGRYKAGMTSREIAEETCRAPGTIRDWIRNVRDGWWDVDGERVGNEIPEEDRLALVERWKG